MLADPGLVIVQPVQVNQKLHVAIESEQRVFVQRMKGSEKNPCLQKPVVHRPRSVFGLLISIVAITGRLTSRPRDNAACATANFGGGAARTKSEELAAFHPIQLHSLVPRSQGRIAGSARGSPQRGISSPLMAAMGQIRKVSDRVYRVRFTPSKRT